MMAFVEPLEIIPVPGVPLTPPIPPSPPNPDLPLARCFFMAGTDDAPAIHDLGLMHVLCPSCKAKHWMAERLQKSSDHHPYFGLCCLQGKVSLPSLEPLPAQLQWLYHTEEQQGIHFRREI